MIPVESFPIPISFLASIDVEIRGRGVKLHFGKVFVFSLELVTFPVSSNNIIKSIKWDRMKGEERRE